MDGTEKSVRLCYSGLQIQGTANSPPITANIVYPKSKNFASVFLLLKKNYPRLPSNAAKSSSCFLASDLVCGFKLRKRRTHSRSSSVRA